MAVTRPQQVSRALTAQAATVAWMIIEGAVAVGAGVAAHSVALTAFGLDSGIEIFTALVVYRQLRGDACNGHGEYTEGERRATRRVGYALYALVGYIVLSSALAVITRTEAAPTNGGIALALAALVVMPGLWWWRRGLAESLDNPALRGDVACSVVCMYMAGTVLVGLVLNGLFGWWWADPLAALTMIWWLRGEAAEALVEARTGRHCDC